MSRVRHLTGEEVVQLHRLVVERSGGALGLRDRAALESALAQPQQTFAGEDLYPSLAEKAAALAHSLVMGHPFVDGNKRVGHAAMEAFLMLNGLEIAASVDEQEALFLRLAAGDVRREALAEWIRDHVDRLA